MLEKKCRKLRRIAIFVSHIVGVVNNPSKTTSPTVSFDIQLYLAASISSQSCFKVYLFIFFLIFCKAEQV